MSEWRIPLADLDIDQQETAAIVRVLEGRWLTQGAETQAFEADFASYLDIPHALAVSNGTAALHLALMALGVGPGDEVLVPSLTFVATVNAVLYTGATPRFVDIISEDDLTLDPEDLERNLTPRSRGIVVMHYGGYACDMERIVALARRHKLFVVEDAAHCPGADLDGRKLGTWGDIGAFSFFSNKNMTTGEGGMVVTQDASVAERLKHLRSHGMTSLTWDRHQGHGFSYDVVALGYNYRTTEIASAMGRVQLRKLDDNNRRRRALVALYRDALRGVHMPFATWRGTPSGHLLPVLVERAEQRPLLMAGLKENRVQSSIHYPPAHLFTYHRQVLETRQGSLRRTEDVAARLVTLPLYAHMTAADVQLVSECVLSTLLRK